MSDKNTNPDHNIGHLMKSAERLGIELDKSAALEMVDCHPSLQTRRGYCVRRSYWSFWP